MRTISGKTLLTVAALGAALVAPAAAEDHRHYGKQISAHLPSLPGVHGSDEIRTSDGTFCRNSTGGSGAFLDMGALASDDGGRRGAMDNVGVYGRLVIPLGKRPKRLDCSTLYALEIERLKAALKLSRMAATGGASPEGWDRSGWTRD